MILGPSASASGRPGFGQWNPAVAVGVPQRCGGYRGRRRPRLLLRQRVAVIAIASGVAAVIARNPLAIHWAALTASAGQGRVGGPVVDQPGRGGRHISQRGHRDDPVDGTGPDGERAGHASRRRGTAPSTEPGSVPDATVTTAPSAAPPITMQTPVRGRAANPTAVGLRPGGGCRRRAPRRAPASRLRAAG